MSSKLNPHWVSKPVSRGIGQSEFSRLTEQIKQHLGHGSPRLPLPPGTKLSRRHRCAAPMRAELIKTPAAASTLFLGGEGVSYICGTCLTWRSKCCLICSHHSKGCRRFCLGDMGVSYICGTCLTWRSKCCLGCMGAWQDAGVNRHGCTGRRNGRAVGRPVWTGGITGKRASGRTWGGNESHGSVTHHALHGPAA